MSERFWSKVNKDGPVPAHKPHLGQCWVWTGATTRGGYGNFRLPNTRQNVRANRYVFFLTYGQYPENALHRCDNPPCCNPAHIYDGTAKDNTRDAIDRGTQHKADFHGEDHPMAVLTEVDVEEIWKLRASGMLLTAIAAKYGVVYQTIQRIMEGVSWSHLSALPLPERPRGKKLTLDDARAIRVSADTGPALAKRYSVTPHLIYLIKQNKAWREVNG